jgi:hypothetical protein
MILVRIVILIITGALLAVGFGIMTVCCVLGGLLAYVADKLGQAFDWYLIWMYRTIHRQLQKL